MNRLWKRMRRRIAVALLGLGLVVAPALRSTCPGTGTRGCRRAPGSGSGRPLDGYLGTVVLVLLAFFIVGKSARR